MTDWKFQIPTAGSKVLPPVARAWEALSSQGYSFQESVTDLVDNSVDAESTKVIIHFLRDGDDLASLIVADDGCGMDDASLDVAMTVGGRQGYSAGALGMFGTGLKSASLSQASSVTVVSKAATSAGVGRRWIMDHARTDHRCDIVEPAYAQALLERYRDRLIDSHGTVVRWDGVKNFPKVGGSSQTDKYLSRLLPELQRHIGLCLHRFLARGKLTVQIMVEDVRTRTVYHIHDIEPLDPFGYPVTGAPEYPRLFAADVEGVGVLSATAHIWTPKSNLTQYKSIGPVIDRQGFYLYRNDRLVQAGGWNGYRQKEAHLALARVAIDLPSKHNDVFRMTVKKSGVETSPAFAAALRQAVSEDGTPFDDYIRAAQTAYRDANKHGERKRKEAVPAGAGVHPYVKKAIGEELSFAPGATPAAFRWGDFEGDELFDLDREQNTVWLNARYRKMISGRHRGGLNDAPLAKALLYLLFYGEGIFTGDRFGPRVKDNLELWQKVLTAAALAEERERTLGD